MLDIVPVPLEEANAFVEQNHRHHKPVVGNLAAKFPQKPQPTVWQRVKQWLKR